MKTPLLQVDDLRVSFDGREVVHGIQLRVQAGEKLALVGESGSGKSVTALSLLRLAQGAHVSGCCRFNGEDILQMNTARLEALRGSDIAMIFQEPMTALNPLFTIGNQISEVLMLKEAMGATEAWTRTIELLAETGIPEPERRVNSFPHQLSGGQRQRAMIAMALACRPKLLLADEPTTALDVSLRAQILDLLDDLQQRHGMAVVLITHDLPLVRRFAHRVAVMEGGHLVEEGPVDEVLQRPVHPYTQRLVDSAPTREVAPVPPDAPVVVSAQGLCVGYEQVLPGIRGWFKKGRFQAVRGVDFELKRGETLGVVGESGSGKSSLALAVLGLHPHEGSLSVMGRQWHDASLTDNSLRRQVQVVFQDPFSSLSPRMTVEELVGEGLLVHAPKMSRADRRQRVLQTLDEVGLDQQQFPGLLSRYPHEFSGGQRQRLAIARALIVQPSVLILDEPTSALDISIQKQVLHLLQNLQRQMGLSYLLITHDIDVIRAMAHQVMVLKDGAVVESGPIELVLEQPKALYTKRLIDASR